ncbi:flagellar motor switch protein FliG [Celeribacter arenosi]|uniref:Flagellar motor switch protein FliG n=1 Tax=Celeribacter arenosi TaxID=792649 RepID=A0ABP7KEW0_9RHOB
MSGLPQLTTDAGGLPELGGFDGAFDPDAYGTEDFSQGSTRVPTALPRKAKVAIIVRLLAAENIKLPLSHFPEQMQVDLAHQMTELRYIDKETLAAVVEEFLDELGAIGLSFPGGLEGALDVLDGTISQTTASKLRKNAGFTFTGDPWERIADVDDARLMPVLEAESVEVGAVLLSKLKVAKAAGLMSKLPGERARRIAYAISLTASISPLVVQRIGISIAARLDAQPPKAFRDMPPERVGAILNFSSSSTREGVLEGLDETDEAFAREVRRNIFTFANIATRLDGRDVGKVVRGVDQAVLVRALAGASGDGEKARDFILGNMSKRMADGLREEMAEMGEIAGPEVEEAMNAVVGAVRELEAAGDIFLLVGDD